MARIKSSSRKIDTVFVVMLFAIFAATTAFVVLVTAKQYKGTAHVMERNYEERTSTSYLRECIHQHDKADTIVVTEFAGLPALCFTETVGDYQLNTYVYCYEGYIRELSSTQGATVTPESGSSLVEATAMEPILINPSLLQINYTDTTGETLALYLTIHNDSGKEAP